MTDFRRIASAAALIGAAMGGMGGSAEVLPRQSTGGAFSSGKAKRHGPNPAGSKLWRKHHRVGSDDFGRMHNNVRGY